VSSSFRGSSTVVFGIITNDDQMEDHKAAHFIGEGANFVSLGTKLAEEAFQQIG
jgi:hypothetical protein